MSTTKNDISNKKVDFYVYDNHAEVMNSVVEDEDHGKLNIVVVPEEQTASELNALYVGDSHIASGWGFRTETDLKNFENLVDNDNIKKIIDADFNLVTYNISYITNEEGELIDTDDTYTYIHSDKISLEDNKLKGKSSLKIYDSSFVKITGSDDLEMKFGDVYDDGVLNDTDFKISYINLVYDILDSENETKTVQYEIKTDESSLHTGEIDLSADGIQHSIRIEDFVNQDVVKSDSDIENNVNYYITFTFDEDYPSVTYKLFTFVFRYKIFGSNFVETPNENSCIYRKNEDNKLEIINTSHSSLYSYVALPTTLSTADSYPIIYEKSNIAAEFNSYTTVQIDGIDYRLYASPQQYTINTTWIVK